MKEMRLNGKKANWYKEIGMPVLLIKKRFKGLSSVFLHFLSDKIFYCSH